jgi:hypothetical protein
MLRIVLLSLIVSLLVTFAYAEDKCPSPIVQTTQDIKGKIDGQVDTLLRLGNIKVAGDIDLVTNDVLHAYPNADHLAIVQNTLSILCNKVLQSPDYDSEFKKEIIRRMLNTLGEDEDQKDEQVRRMISQINPSTPPQRLTQIFGSPISSGRNEWSERFSLEVYQYKYTAWVFDYRSGSERVALVLATKDPFFGQSMLFDQIQGIDILAAYNDCGGVRMNGHYDAASKPCSGGHSTNFVQSIYFFYRIFVTQLKEGDSSDQCGPNGNVPPEPNKCPGYASVPALAVAMISNPNSDKLIENKLNRVATAFLGELDSDFSIQWLSPEESKINNERIQADDKMSPAESDALFDRNVLERAKKYSALIH